MPASTPEHRQLVADALTAALAVAAEHGLREIRPVVLKDGANLLVHLSPAPVVARIATMTGLVRPDVGANLARDLSIASYLTGTGAAAVPPTGELPPGPHHRDGHAITFWRYVAHDPDHRYEPAEFALLLADLHAALRDYPGQLPDLPPLDVAGTTRLLDAAGLITPAELAELTAAGDRIAAALRAADEPGQPLHGDAHPGNVLHTADGPLWNDFEDTWRGPVAWDLACLAQTGRLDGRAALAGYPGAPGLDELGISRVARNLQGTLWALLMAVPFPARRDSGQTWLRTWQRSTGTESG
ncbi:MAG TPA: phosphotransferase [Pseudonocardiaceae bacterium]|jgi:hypothetical protein|nr:phosphotransferase [Pseudonocardiaceae bacterium]